MFLLYRRVVALMMDNVNREMYELKRSVRLNNDKRDIYIILWSILISNESL